MGLLPVINGYQFENNDLAHLALMVQGGIGGVTNEVKGAFFTETILVGKPSYDFSALAGKRILGFSFLDNSSNEQTIPPNTEYDDMYCEDRAERLMLKSLMQGDGAFLFFLTPKRFVGPTLAVTKASGAVSVGLFITYTD